MCCQFIRCVLLLSYNYLFILLNFVQDYDPDLPPELAAAAGIQEIPSENLKLGKMNAVQMT